MKLKKGLLVMAAMFVGAASSNAATFIISNLTDGPGDTLYASKSNVPLSGGVVTIGYFNSPLILQSNIDTIGELRANLSNFITVTSIALGNAPDLGAGQFAGYAQQTALTSIGPVNVGDSLFGRTIYSIVTDAASLALSLADSQFGLLNVGTLTGDTPNEVSVSANPKGITPIIGSTGQIVGDFAGDNSTSTDTFGTFRLDQVPEPSAALLGAIGALGLLRRRRN